MSARAIRYVIRDARGAIVAYHDRHPEPNGGKRFAWSLPDGTPGLAGRKTASLPLYGAHLAGRWSVDRPVIVTEGEKAAGALIRAGWQAAGSVTGASGCPDREALSILAGLDVLLWPDNDEAGGLHGLKLARALGDAGEIAASVGWIVWRDAPAGGDAADYLAAGGDVAALIAEATPAPLPKPAAATRPERVRLPAIRAERPIDAYNDEHRVSELLRDAFGIEARPGRAVRCPWHDDRSPSLSILPDDRRAFCHSPSCELHNGGRGRDAWDLAQLVQAVPA